MFYIPKNNVYHYNTALYFPQFLTAKIPILRHRNFLK